MATITTTMNAITEMLRGHMGAVLLDAIVRQSTFNSVKHLVEQFASFVRHFVTTKWGGKHVFILIVLREAKIQLAARNKNCDCKRLENPKLLNPRIEYSTQGHKLLQLQVGQKFEWQKYTF